MSIQQVNLFEKEVGRNSYELEVPWRRTMPERIKQVGSDLWVNLDDGRLLSAPLATLAWAFVLEDAGRVKAVAG